MGFMGTFSMVNYDDKRVSLPNFSSDTQISTPKAKIGGLSIIVVFAVAHAITNAPNRPARSAYCIAPRLRLQ